MTAPYDYVIVGGGSSGCAAASRLVRDHGARVLMLESGGRDTSPLFKMPAGFIKFLKGSKHIAFHQAKAQDALGGRRPIIPQGRVLGGGSTVNGMVYIRGQADDYAEWDRAAGGAGWSFRHMLPYFTAQEGNQRLGGVMHGATGPLKVSDHRHRAPISSAFVAALQNLGYALNPDFNGGFQAGVGYLQLTTDGVRRVSAVTAFLDPLKDDPRLTVETGCLVTKVLIERGRAVGVAYEANGAAREVRADKEVILAAGAYETPKLLMLSGVGPEEELSRHGLATVVDLPGVGRNLQDHHEVPLVALTHENYGYFGEDKGLRMVANGLQYLLFKSGPVTSNGVEACLFVNPDAPNRDASLQIYCVPTVHLGKDVDGPPDCAGVTFNACLLRPKARGSVTLSSADPHDPPVVDPNFLGDPDDLRLSIEGLRTARTFLTASPLKEMVAGEIFPGEGVVSDEALAEHCRRTVKTNYHPVGTCRMGSDGDAMAVLTPDLRVRGIESLRVIDASMMPVIISGNTNATALAVGARAADLIAGKPTLPPVDLPNRLPASHAA